MTAFRAFVIPEGSRAGNFAARVEQFVGITAVPGGIAILTFCDEPPGRLPAPPILGPSGVPVGAALRDGEPIWAYLLVPDFGEVPRSVDPQRAFYPLGGIFAAGQIVFVFVMRVD